MIKTQPNIPIPPRKQGRWAKYPWATLQVGDSFLLPGKLAEVRPKTFGLYSTAKRLGMVITVRPDPAGKGFRVWRLK